MSALIITVHGSLLDSWLYTCIQSGLSYRCNPYVGAPVRAYDADASKHVAVFTILKYFLYICCAFVGLDNKLLSGYLSLGRRPGCDWANT